MQTQGHRQSHSQKNQIHSQIQARKLFKPELEPVTHPVAEPEPATHPVPEPEPEKDLDLYTKLVADTAKGTHGARAPMFMISSENEWMKVNDYR